MLLCNGRVGETYLVKSVHLPEHLEKRLEALGVTVGTAVTVLNKKGHGILAVKFRGTRFAWGSRISGSIEVVEPS